jgi:hypothetical protein
MFFAESQNKLLFATTQKTAAELILDRANDEAVNMGLINWKGSVVRKQDITVAKNYLSADEIDTLNRLVVIFLETAELRAKNRTDLTMNFWRENFDRILVGNDMPLLEGKGAVSHKQMEQAIHEKYERFDSRRKQYEARFADEQDMKELAELEQKIKRDRSG